MEAIFANRRKDLYYYTDEWAHLLDETFTRALLTQRYVPVQSLAIGHH